MNKTKEKFEVVKLSEEKVEMTLPEHWVESETSPERTNMGYLRTFVMADKSGPCIYYFRRRAPMPSECADDFASILAKPSHALSEPEWQKLNHLYFPAGSQKVFDKHRCETTDLNGRKVLLLEGLWKELGDIHLSFYFNYSIWVHMFCYSAAPDVFQEFLPEAKEAFETVVWKVAAD